MVFEELELKNLAHQEIIIEDDAMEILESTDQGIAKVMPVKL